jgi:hypothetical protein
MCDVPPGVPMHDAELCFTNAGTRGRATCCSDDKCCTRREALVGMIYALTRENTTQTDRATLRSAGQTHEATT